MGKILQIICLLLIPLWAATQNLPDLRGYKTAPGKLEALADICDSLTRNEMFAREKEIAHYALTIVPTGNWYYYSLFNFNLGVAWEPERGDSAAFYLEKSAAFAQKAKHQRREVNALDRLLFLYTNVPGYKRQRDKTLKTLLRLIDTTQDEVLKADLAATIGNYYNMQGAYETQIKYLLQAITIKKKLIAAGKIKDMEAVVVDLMGLGELYIGMNQAEKGIGYIRESSNYINVTQYYRNYFYKNMADAHLAMQQPDSAKPYRDSLTYMLEGNTVPGRRHNLIASDLAFADYYLGINQPDNAMPFIREANELAPKWAGELLNAQVQYMTGTLYAAQKQYAKALPLLRASEAICRDSGPEIYVGLLQSLAKCYAATGQWQQAYQYYDQYVPLRDSLYRESAKKSIADAEAQYQNKEKQQQIEIRNIQISEAQKRQIWLIAGISLMGLSLVLLAVIYINKRKNAHLLDTKNQQLGKLIEELEEANRTKAKLFSIISHDLRSPISQVYQFLKLQQLNPRLLNENQKQELSEKIQTATGSLLETMEDLLLWSKTQMNQFKADMQPAEVAQVAIQCVRLLQLNIDAKMLVIENRIPENVLIETDPYYLQAILRNLLQNAIKASEEKSVIKLEWSRAGALNVLSIENGGSAFTHENYLTIVNQSQDGQGLSGLGLRLVEELSAKIGAAIAFHNPDPQTTRAEITFG